MVESHSSGCLIFHQLLQLQQLLLHRATRRIKGLHQATETPETSDQEIWGKLWRPMGTNGDLTIKKPSKWGLTIKKWGFNHQKTWGEVRNLEISHEILADVRKFPIGFPQSFPGKSLKSLREVPQVHRGRFLSKSVDGLIETKNDGAVFLKEINVSLLGNLPHNQQRSPAATAQCAGTAR